MPRTTVIWRHQGFAQLSERGRSVATFGAWVGIFAIFIDASIAHGLFWENDPYWTYWVTKTFLITTVFTLGTALFGIGLWQGLVLTAVHTLILEVYYQWFAPVGLPQARFQSSVDYRCAGPFSGDLRRLRHRLVDLAPQCLRGTHRR